MAAKFSPSSTISRVARRSVQPVRVSARVAGWRRRIVARCIVAVVLIIAMLGVWMSAGLAQSDDSARAARSAMVKSLDPIKGRYHQVHGMTLKLHCGTCHVSDRPDALVEGEPPGQDGASGQPVAAAMPGRVDRGACIGCHKAGARPAGADK
jgi:hypothetical protein